MRGYPLRYGHMNASGSYIRLGVGCGTADLMLPIWLWEISLWKMIKWYRKLCILESKQSCGHGGQKTEKQPRKVLKSGQWSLVKLISRIEATIWVMGVYPGKKMKLGD